MEQFNQTRDQYPLYTFLQNREEMHDSNQEQKIMAPIKARI